MESHGIIYGASHSSEMNIGHSIREKCMQMYSLAISGQQVSDIAVFG